ncbi:MAG: hypothetical protein KAY59_05485 [Acidobacteria bacterium]|jgi:hypothetical protein|nr:hypothetical protein [Acidobacteriota bacterium]
MESRVDSVMQQLARELSEAIAAALAADTRIEACREKARAEGYELKLSLDASVGFVETADGVAATRAAAARRIPVKPAAEMTPTDRRFLKSLRIAADEPAEKEVE